MRFFVKSIFTDFLLRANFLVASTRLNLCLRDRDGEKSFHGSNR